MQLLRRDHVGAASPGFSSMFRKFNHLAVRHRADMQVSGPPKVMPLLPTGPIAWGKYNANRYRNGVIARDVRSIAPQTG
jgi:hypothetical protein